MVRVTFGEEQLGEQQLCSAVGLVLGGLAAFVFHDVALRIEQERQRQKERGIESATHLILAEDTGQPWEQKRFQVMFAEIRKAAAAIWPAAVPIVTAALLMVRVPGITVTPAVAPVVFTVT
jgi:hypothetical protein